MLPFTRPPSCALGTSFYTILEGSDLMTYVNDNYTSYSASCGSAVHNDCHFIAVSTDIDQPRFGAFGFIGLGIEALSQQIAW